MKHSTQLPKMISPTNISQSVTVKLKKLKNGECHICSHPLSKSGTSSTIRNIEEHYIERHQLTVRAWRNEDRAYLIEIQKKAKEKTLGFPLNEKGKFSCPICKSTKLTYNNIENHLLKIHIEKGNVVHENKKYFAIIAGIKWRLIF